MGALPKYTQCWSIHYQKKKLYFATLALFITSAFCITYYLKHRDSTPFIILTAPHRLVKYITGQAVLLRTNYSLTSKIQWNDVSYTTTLMSLKYGNKHSKSSSTDGVDSSQYRTVNKMDFKGEIFVTKADLNDQNIVQTDIIDSKHQETTTREIMNSKDKCDLQNSEKRSVYFLKSHKTGSTTLRNILQRFTLSRNLSTPVLMRQHSYPSRNLTKYLRSIPTYYKIFQEFKSSGNRNLNDSMKLLMNIISEKVKIENNQCDILDVHTVLNIKEALKIFPSPPVFIATLRHPFSQMKSAFKQWDLARHLKIPTSNTSDEIETFLSDPQKYDKLLPASLYNVIAKLENLEISFTKNYIAYEFGFDLGKSAEDNSYVEEYLRKLNETIRVVIFTDYFVESLILLKRELCWSFEDILFIHLRNNNYKSKLKEYGKQEMRAHRKWTELDYRIYDMFIERHRRLVEQGGELFQKELSAFSDALAKVTAFCMDEVAPVLENKKLTSNEYKDLLAKAITVKRTEFNGEFRIMAADCVLMTLNENVMWIATRVQRYPELCDPEFTEFIEDHVEDGVQGVVGSERFCQEETLKYNIPLSYGRKAFWKT